MSEIFFCQNSTVLLPIRLNSNDNCTKHDNSSHNMIDSVCSFTLSAFSEILFNCNLLAFIRFLYMPMHVFCISCTNIINFLGYLLRLLVIKYVYFIKSIDFDITSNVPDNERLLSVAIFSIRNWSNDQFLSSAYSFFSEDTKISDFKIKNGRTPSQRSE